MTIGAPSADAVLDVSGQELDVLYVAPDRFRRSPQLGVACRMSWREVCAYLSRPTVGEAKDVAGAWSAARYRNNVRRKASLLRVCALVVDVDDGGEVDRIARLLARYAAIIHDTFSSTAGTPRCRIVILLVEPVDAVTYEAAHSIVRAHLRRAGVVADAAAKDASRLSFAPVRRPGDGYRIRVTVGAPLDAKALMAAQRFPPLNSRAAPAGPVGAETYARGALRSAVRRVALAKQGTRNRTLFAEAFAIARLPLDPGVIERALADSARFAGLPPGEASRTIASALRARGLR
jgi:hypothetical protein